MYSQLFNCQRYDFNYFTGMTVSNFHGIQSLKEVKCSGSTLPNEVKFLSLTLYKKLKISRNSQMEEKTLTSLETSPENTCHTYGEFSSCVIDETDRRNSIVKTLVSDLEGGERTYIGCNVTAVYRIKNDVFKGYWNIEVFRQSK